MSETSEYQPNIPEYAPGRLASEFQNRLVYYLIGDETAMHHLEKKTAEQLHQDFAYLVQDLASLFHLQ